MESLEKELGSSAALEKAMDLSPEIEAIFRKFHELLPTLLALESNPRKVNCVKALEKIRDVRDNDIPALENKIRALRDGVKAVLKKKRDARAPEKTERLREIAKNTMLKHKNK